MIPTDIPTLRLHHQLIAGGQAATPSQVVRTLGAMQGQDYGSVLWGIGLRLPGSTVAAIETAIAAGEIVRSWVMRGTLHFTAAGDLRWMLNLLAPRNLRSTGRRDQQLGLDAATYARSREVLEGALAGGRLTRAAVMHTLEEAGIATTGQRGYHILWHLGQQGVLCFGPMAGKQPTFVLLDDWVPPASPVDREEALAELTRRYFSGHGPATEQDLAHWAGLTLTEVREGLALTGTTLQEVAMEGQRYWMVADADPLASTPSAILLPGFDEYLIGYKERSAVLDPLHAGKAVPGGNGMFKPMMVLGGRVVGTWRKQVRRGNIEVQLEPFEKMTPPVLERFEEAIGHYRAFIG